MVFLKCIGITVIVALLVGLVGYFMDANSDSDTGLIIVAAVIFSVVLLSTGRFTGWLIILAGVFAVIYTFQLEKAYREFCGS